MSEEHAQTPPAGDWFASADDGVKGHLVARGWDRLEPGPAALIAAKSHLEAMKIMAAPADEMVRLPKEPTDPAWQKVWERLGAPASPDVYKFDDVRAKDGTQVSAEFDTFIRQSAHSMHLTPDAAKTLAQGIVTYTEGERERLAGEMSARAAGADTALRGKWQGGYDVNMFTARQGIEKLGLPIDVDAPAFKADPKYADNMEALRSVGARLQEASYLGGGGGGANSDAGATRESAIQRLEVLKQDRSWFERFINREHAAVQEFADLTRKAAGG